MSASISDLLKKGTVPANGTYDLGVPLGTPIGGVNTGAGANPAGVGPQDREFQGTLGEWAMNAAGMGLGVLSGGALGTGALFGNIGWSAVNGGTPSTSNTIKGVRDLVLGKPGVPATPTTAAAAVDAGGGLSSGQIGASDINMGAGALGGTMGSGLNSGFGDITGGGNTMSGQKLAGGGRVRGGPAMGKAPVFGLVRGAEPGVDTVDAVLAEGSYVVPRHIVEAIGEAPADRIHSRYGEPGEHDAPGVLAHVSGGEYIMSPAQVERAGGAEALDQMLGIASEPKSEYAEGGEVLSAGLMGAPPPAAPPPATPATAPSPGPVSGPTPEPHAKAPSFFEMKARGVAPYPMVTNPEEAEKLPGGTKFRSPDGQIRIRPYDVTDDASYAEVPLGEHYREGGETKRKPEADGGVNVVAQTLYDMAKTPAGRKKALSMIYGSDAVEDDRGELYIVTADGKRLSPRAKNAMALASRAGGAIASGALPAAGGIVGGLAGGGAGALTGPGAIAAGSAGAALGSGLGEWENQKVLQNLGVEELSIGESAKEIALAGAAGGVGQAVGSVLPAIPAALRAAGSRAGDWASKRAANFIGAQPEATAMVAQINKEGGRAPIHAYGTESPFMRYLDQFAKKFGYDPVTKAAREVWYPAMSSDMLKMLGVPEADRNIIGRTAAISLEPTGEASRDAARTLLGERTLNLERTIEAARRDRVSSAAQTAGSDVVRFSAEKSALQKSAAEFRKAADEAIDQGISDVSKTVDTVLRDTNTSPGDLSRAFANVITGARKHLGDTARVMYRAADEAAGDTLPNTAPLKAWAQSVVDDVPPVLRQEYPKEIETLARLAGKSEGGAGAKLLGPDGSPIEAPKNVTFGDLHQLRNFLRAKVNWGDLTRTPSQGARVNMDQQITAILHDANAAPELRAASGLLRDADDYYRENIRKFEDTTVEKISQFGRSATASDAETLADLTLKEGNMERIRLLREMGGPELWNHVVAADTRGMLNAAGARTGKVDSEEFAKQIMDRARSGVLQEAYPKEVADQLRLQADRIARAGGKVPMEHRPGDSVMTMLDRADAHIARAEAIAEKAPLKTLKEQVKVIDGEMRAALAAGQKEIDGHPLHSLTNLEANAAAHKILGSPDLIAAAEREFGANSPEFTMLRQTYARQLLQDIADAAIPAPGVKGGSLGSVTSRLLRMTPETQERLFPGVTREQMVNLTKKIVLMFPEAQGEIGAGMAAGSMIMNPTADKIPVVGGLAKAALGGIKPPGFLMRITIGKAMDWISRALTHPTTVSIIVRGLEGNSSQQAAAMATLQALIGGATQRGAAGAAAGGYGARFAGGQAPEPPEDQGEAAPLPSWRDRVVNEGVAAGGWRSRVR